MNYQGIKVSTNWDSIKSFQWFCENAKFIFSHKSYSGERIKIVLKEPLVDHFDCFEIGYDRYGVLISADTVFSSGWGNMIEDSSKEIISYIKDYLKREGAYDLITNPELSNFIVLPKEDADALEALKRAALKLGKHR